jgi:hypothetical protein
MIGSDFNRMAQDFYKEKIKQDGNLTVFGVLGTGNPLENQR